MYLNVSIIFINFCYLLIDTSLKQFIKLKSSEFWNVFIKKCDFGTKDTTVLLPLKVKVFISYCKLEAHHFCLASDFVPLLVVRNGLSRRFVEHFVYQPGFDLV